jgi:amino-acid N-acetyltransferase
VRELLSSVLLPTEGLADQFPAGFVVARENETTVGSAGLERYEDVGLLRSVAVRNERRGSGLGGALVGDRLQSARAQGVNAVYLLTTTAAPYFEKFGFVVTPRADVRGALARSAEFAHACPASATCLIYRL